MILRFTISKLNASQHFRRALARFTTGLPKGWKTFVFVGQMQILLRRILVTNYGGHASSQSRPKPRPARKWRSCGVKKCKLRPRERSPIFLRLQNLSVDKARCNAKRKVNAFSASRLSKTLGKKQ